MNALAVTRLPVLGLLAGSLLLSEPSAHALFDFFKKSDKKVPTAEELPAQEAQATAMLNEARALQTEGKGGRAQSLYQDVVKQFPFTQAASEAAYARALLVREGGRLQDAFDAFQQLIDDYRQSPRFADSIERQFEIAEEAKGGKKERSLIILPMKMSAEDVVTLYRQVITNAPFGKFAPLAQFSIGEVYQDKGDKDLAVVAYQGVVDNYPGSQQADEAQFRIGAISNMAAQRSQDTSNLTATRDALNTYVAANPEGTRASEASAILSQVNEAEAAESLSIGKFYEQQNKPKAAAIYYNEALKFGGAEASNEARNLLARLSQSNPDAVVDTEGQPMQDFTVPAAVDLLRSSDYVGPPSPELARLSEKPQMRTEDDDFMPIPLQEPSLPTRPGASSQPAPGMLLPPAAPGERPPLLPIPPVPELDRPSAIPPQSTDAPLLPVPPLPPVPAEVPAPITPPEPTPAS